MATQLYPGIPFSPQAVLSEAIGAADTIIKVSDVSAFPDPPNLATIGTDETGETILYVAKTSEALSGCTRGIEGTAKAWAAGELIGRNFTAKDHADLIAAVSEVRSSAEEAVTSASAAQEAAGNASTAAGNAQTAAETAQAAASEAASAASTAATTAQAAATAAQEAQEAAQGAADAASTAQGAAEAAQTAAEQADQTAGEAKETADHALEVAESGSAQFMFEVNDSGHLIMSYTDRNNPPDAEVGSDGHLYLTIN